MAGIPQILVGQSGENVGRTAIQVWEKVSISLVKNDKKRGATYDGPWLLLVFLSTLFVLENILVRPIRCSKGSTTTEVATACSYHSYLYSVC